MNNHPRLSVLFLLLILLIVIMIIYRIADKYMNNSTTETGTYYTYVGEIKYDFDADVTINKKLVINNLKPANKMDFSSNPIIGEKRIIFPKDMLAVMPSDNYAEYRTLPYTYISEDKLITKDYNETLKTYRDYLIKELIDREEGYTDGKKLIVKQAPKVILENPGYKKND